MTAKRPPVAHAMSSLLTKKIGIQELLVTGVMKMIRIDSGTNHVARRSQDWNIVRDTNARIIAIGRNAMAKKKTGFVNDKEI